MYRHAYRNCNRSAEGIDENTSFHNLRGDQVPECGQSLTGDRAPASVTSRDLHFKPKI